MKMLNYINVVWKINTVLHIALKKNSKMLIFSTVYHEYSYMKFIRVLRLKVIKFEIVKINLILKFSRIYDY